jgi:predicted CXXCH cytochrome family protein
MAQTGEKPMFMKFRRLFMLMTILSILYGTGPVSASETDDGPAEIIGSHSATTDCVQCHGNRLEQASPDAAELIASVPMLCSTCHHAYASLEGWVHGPAATGDCLFCHDSHRSEYSFLLKRSIPELCYECHTAETQRLIAGHLDESHSHCGTCHESHAGANRKLLKQSFLSTEAGSVYRDETAYHQPQYTFVDRRASLAGLRGVRVIPSVERRDLLSRYDVTPEIVKAEIERCLRERGARILSTEGQATAQPGLYVVLRLVELRFPGYSNEVCALSGSIDMSFRQTVELVSQPSDAERRLCLATTWDTSAVVVWGMPKIQEGLKNATEVLVDRFCSDYLAANPSDKQSLPERDASGNSEYHIGR